MLDFGTDKYGLDAYFYDSTDDSELNYDRVLFARDKDGNDQVADFVRASGPTSRSTSIGGALNGLTGGLLIKVETLNVDASQVRLFHTSVSRANATWPSWPGEQGFTATSPNTSRRSSRAPRPPTSPSSRPASSARTPTSSRACTGRRLTIRCSST